MSTAKKRRREPTYDVDTFIDKNLDRLVADYIEDHDDEYMWDDCFERAEDAMLGDIKWLYSKIDDIMHDEYARYIHFSETASIDIKA